MLDSYQQPNWLLLTKLIRSLQCQPRIQYSNALPLCTTLSKFTHNVSSFCCLCNDSQVEKSLHLSLNCQFSYAVWFGLGLNHMHVCTNNILIQNWLGLPIKKTNNRLGLSAWVCACTDRGHMSTKIHSFWWKSFWIILKKIKFDALIIVLLNLGRLTWVGGIIIYLLFAEKTP